MDRIVSNLEMEEQSNGSLDVWKGLVAVMSAAALSQVAFLGLHGRAKVGFPIHVLVVFVHVPDSL